MNRNVFAALAALFITVGLVACGGGDDDDGGGGGDGSPIRVALIPPSTGPLAPFGADAVKAWEFAAEEVNAAGGVDGHKVELIKSETDGQPPTTVRAARKAVTQDQAQFISGVITSPEWGALQQQLPSMGAVAINSIGKDDPLTGEGCSANAFRVAQSNAMDVNAIAANLDKLPGERWAIQAADYSTGHTAAESFKAAAEKAGKQVVLTQYAPLGTTEYGSYITKLKNSDADALFAFVIGADAVAFINQGAQFKLFDEIETVLGMNMVSEPLFEALGDNIVGFYNNLGYDVADDNPKNQAFVDAWTKNHGSPPYYVQADNYLAAQVLFEAVKNAGSTDPEEVKAAMRDLSFDTFVGEVSMSADNQLARGTYVGQIVKNGDGLGWKVAAEVDAATAKPEPDPACELAE